MADFHRVGVESPINNLGSSNVPARMHLENLAEKAGLDFVINTVLAGDHQLYRIFGGHPRSVQTAARDAARDVYGVPVSRRYDVVVSNAYPAFLEFWQAAKGIFSGDLILNREGTVILIAPCPEGIGVTHPDQVEYLGLDHAELLNRISSKQVKDPIAAGVCAMVGHIKNRARVIVVSPGLSRQDVQSMGFEFSPGIDHALASVWVDYGSKTEVAVITHGSETVPYLI